MLTINGNPAYDENVEDQPPFKEIIDGDMAIQNDVRFSRYVADVLESFTSIPVTDQLDDLPSVEVHGKPAQVSLITKNGVNRIYNAQHGELEEYYASLFPADQFFPSRPYFRRAFQKGRSGSVDKLVPTDRQTLGDYFYVSHPYVDLGGNGIIVSLARDRGRGNLESPSLFRSLRVKEHPTHIGGKSPNARRRNPCCRLSNDGVGRGSAT